MLLLTTSKDRAQFTEFAKQPNRGRDQSTAAGVADILDTVYNDGWRLKVDGVETPMFRVNFGMLGATVVGGEACRQVDYAIPGLRLGILLGLVALLLLVGLGLMQFRRNHNL